MDVLATQVVWEFLAVVLAVIATLFGLLGKFGGVVERLIEARRIRIRRKNIKGLLLTPTVEETAKYSVKVPQKYKADEQYHLKLEKQINRIIINELNDPVRQRTEGRIIVLAVFFFTSFLVIAAKIIGISLGLW